MATHVITLNPEMVLADHARSNPALHAADLYVADGVGIVLAARRLLRIDVERYPGIDLAHDLLARLAEDGGSVYLLGSAPGVAQQAAANLTAALPGLTIAGTRDGFFAPGGDAEVAQQIAQSGADALLVGMGSPRQEGFISMYRETLRVPVMIGVGGALDVFAGLKRRAPRAVQRLGLEWLWRGLIEPSRLKRQLALLRFAALVMKSGRAKVGGAGTLAGHLKNFEGVGPRDHPNHNESTEAAQVPSGSNSIVAGKCAGPTNHD